MLTNTALDTGLSTVPQWQNISPLDCLYSTIDWITLQVRAYYTSKLDVSPFTKPSTKEATRVAKPTILHFAGISDQNNIRLLNVGAAFAALVLYTSAHSCAWEKVLTTNALICWIANRFSIAGDGSGNGIAATPSASSFELKGQKVGTSAGLAFVCAANVVSWWLIPGITMDAQRWTYFLLSSILLCAFAILMPGSSLLPPGNLSRLFLGVLESSFWIVIWLFGYSDAATSVAAREGSQHSGLSSLYQS